MQEYVEVLLESAYIEHRSSLVRRLTALCRDPEAAEDIAQEAFLRLGRELDAGRAPDNTGAWLHRVGANLATSQARRAQVATRHETELPKPAEPASPERIVVESELAEAVGAVMEELSTPERHALMLAANGVGGTEIAASIGRTPGATRTLLCRARAKIRERMNVAGFAYA
jgi:RNA polymerase sigma factor (sigma-70 family)